VSVIELKNLIEANISPLIGEEYRAALVGILAQAEIDLASDTKAIPVDPFVTTPEVIQATVGAMRAEKIADAIMDFLIPMPALIASATATAVVGFLNAHATATYLPGTLQVLTQVTPPLFVPVVALAPATPVSIITY
jgi:hypothetical protein